MPIIKRFLSSCGHGSEAVPLPKRYHVFEWHIQNNLESRFDYDDGVKAGFRKYGNLSSIVGWSYMHLDKDQFPYGFWYTYNPEVAFEFIVNHKAEVRG